MNQGNTYLVTSLDTWSKEALCKAANLDYYTKPRDCTRVHIMGGNMVCQLLTFVRCSECLSINCMSQSGDWKSMMVLYLRIWILIQEQISLYVIQDYC